MDTGCPPGPEFTDGSPIIAHAWARLLFMAAEGYFAAHSRFIIMSNADDSYEFLLLPVCRCHLPPQEYGVARRDTVLRGRTPRPA